VARGAIIIVDDHRKLGFHSWHLLPKAAICDPGLTLGLPPLLTAATGMDAIAHCMETFMAARLQPAGRRHRAGRPGARLGAHRSAPPATAATAKPA
jgi:alcohol dehydrogenase class IV